MSEISVDTGAVKGRLILRRLNRLPKNPVKRLIQRNSFWFQRMGNQGVDEGEDLVDRGHGFVFQIGTSFFNRSIK